MSSGMDLTPLVSPDSQIVNGFYPGGFRISGVRHDGPLIVLPTQVMVWSGEIAFSSFKELDGVELLLIGTGDEFTLIQPALRIELKGLGMSAEAMTTPAACRTYNVLLSEGRKIAAALLPIA